MQVMDSETKFAHLGKPGETFSKGFARRLRMMQERVEFKDKKILDLGCGKGVWLDQFRKLTDVENVYGEDVDSESIADLIAGKSQYAGRVVACPAESLTFPNDFFDIVFANEVIEHVDDDRKVTEEVLRVLKPGGVFIQFTPNRGWPFETHGIFLFGKYIWGNIPLIPWMPKFVYRFLAPHVRNYTNRDIRRLFKGLDAEIVHHSHIFPGFDGLSRRFGVVGRVIQKFFFFIERTPLHFFGISHFVIVRKR